MNPETQQETTTAEIPYFGPKITVTRSMVHKGKIAPAGCAYFIAKAKDKTHTYHMHQLMRTSNMTVTEEETVKQDLIKAFKEHFKLS